MQNPEPSDVFRVALADLLADMGWDGGASSIGLPVGGLGCVEVFVKPFDAVLTDTGSKLVTADVFLRALRGGSGR